MSQFYSSRCEDTSDISEDILQELWELQLDEALDIPDYLLEELPNSYNYDDDDDDIRCEQQGDGIKDIRTLYDVQPKGVTLYKHSVEKHRLRMSFHKEINILLPENHRTYAMAILDYASSLPLAYNPNVKVGFEIISKSFGSSLFVHPRPFTEFTANFLEREIDTKMQSARSMDSIDSKVDVEITFLKPVTGSGRQKGMFFINKLAKGTIAPIKVREYCLGSAIGYAICHIEKKIHANDKSIKAKFKQWTRLNDDKPLQSPACRKEAREILENSGITKAKDYSLEDVRAVQEYLKGKYQIVVVVDDHDPQPVYSGPLVDRIRIIPLLLKDGHFNYIFSLPQYMNKGSFYCTICNVGLMSETLHYTCPIKCAKCLGDNCPKSGTDNIECADCHVIFYLRECYDRHKLEGPPKAGEERGSSRCSRTEYCEDCSEIHYTDRGIAHVCGQGYCRTCKCNRAKDHKHTLAIRPPPKKVSRKRIYFDMECSQEMVNGVEEHKVVLACALRVCPQCSDVMPRNRAEALELTCTACSEDGKRYHEFDNIAPKNASIDVVQTFCKWLFSRKHKKFSVICHNMKGYDGQFILQYLLRPNTVKPSKVIMNGKKVNYIQVGSIKLVDSFNFVPFALKKFSTAFEIPELCKGEFPFTFIKRENFAHNAKIPHKDFFNYEERTDKEAFDQWYTERSKTPYCFYDEIRKYCWADVALLAAAMTKFEQSFYDQTKVLLFEEAVTSASAAMLTFQRNFLEDGAIVLDGDSSSMRIRQSTIAKRFLSYLQTTESEFIHTGNNTGEQKIPGTAYHVDGYIESCNKYKKGLAIEFKGCYWHAHECNYAPNQIVRGNQRAIDIRQNDAEREAQIEKICEIKVYWECEVKAKAKRDKLLDSMLKRNMAEGPADAREALFGGRTEVLRLYASASDSEELMYDDVCSLYPDVMKNCEYPLGESTVLAGTSFPCPISKPGELELVCRGLISCQVLAPRNLYIPVLPFKSDKLLFTLCRTCGEEKQETKCTHFVEERSLYGTWTSAELELAISKGYKILNVFAGVHWERWSSEIFSGYINTFLKVKQEASGYPDWVKTEEDRDQYIEAYRQKEQVCLEKAKIRKDQVLRQVAKLLLNSLWGKFGQRSDLPRTQIIDSESQLVRLMNNPTLEICNVQIHNKDVLTVLTRAVDGTLQPLSTNSLPYAVYTTSYARIKLYKILDAIPNPKHNVLYTDTDSVIYRKLRNEENPLASRRGEYLGQLTCEVSRGYEMMDYVSVGPKSYAYREQSLSDTRKIKTKVKAKGFPLKGDAEHKITYNALRNQVNAALCKDPNPPNVSVKYRSITRNAKHRLINRPLVKTFKFTFDKRRVLSDGSTLPFGFEENK